MVAIAVNFGPSTVWRDEMTVWMSNPLHARPEGEPHPAHRSDQWQIPMLFVSRREWVRSDVDWLEL